MRPPRNEAKVAAALSTAQIPMTVEQVAVQAGMTLNSVRRAVLNLREEGAVQIVGRRRVGKSRPWNLYRLGSEVAA